MERGELVKLAARKAAHLFPDGGPISLKVHVGDTVSTQPLPLLHPGEK